MSITVNVRTTCTMFEDTYSSSRGFQEAFSSAVRQASQVAGVLLQEDRIVYTGSNMPVPPAQQRLGNQDITVITHPAPTINNLLVQMQFMQQSMATAHAPRLRNIAAQILLHAAGQADFRGEAAECDYYRQLGASHSGVCTISEALRVQPRRFIEQADAVIERRNALIHPVTLAVLDEEVAELTRVISPALQQLCRWECDVLLHYDEFKAAFPARFQAQPLE